jgi:hypothetical protein
MEFSYGDSLQFQHRNPPEFSDQDSPIQLGEIRKWNTEYLRIVENNANALAVKQTARQ